MSNDWGFETLLASVFFVDPVAMWGKMVRHPAVSLSIIWC